MTERLPAAALLSFLVKLDLECLHQTPIGALRRLSPWDQPRLSSNAHLGNPARARSRPSSPDGRYFRAQKLIGALSASHSKGMAVRDDGVLQFVSGSHEEQNILSSHLAPCGALGERANG